MFKVAPRYLSGVSVFLGDDITTRTTEGELAIVLGQATKGPRVPVQLSSVDGAVAIYGSDNPLVDALYQFNDGYNDAGKKTAIKFVTLRVGGIASSLVTSFGLEIETVDAYDGIENDCFVWASNQPALNGLDRAGVKIWDKNKRLVYNSFTGLDAGYFTVTSVPDGAGLETAIYGVDLDEDFIETPVSIADLSLLDLSATTLGVTGALASSATTITVTGDASTFPKTGIAKVYKTLGATTVSAYVNYTNITGQIITLSGQLGIDIAAGSSVKIVASTLIPGDSQAGLTYRETYELMRNALLDIEMYTPDFIVPGGCPYNAVDTYQKQNIASTMLKANTLITDTSILVDGAALWPATGVVDVYDGTIHNQLSYTSKVVEGSDYRLNVATPTISITSIAASGALQYRQINVASVVGLNDSGTVKIGTGTYNYDVVNALDGYIVTTIVLAVGDRASNSLQKITNAIDIVTTPSTATCTWFATASRELGIGYVSEVDSGDKFTFTWSDTKLAGYNIAHFGYLFANFCNEATIGYNTPLCGMNVDISTLKAENFSRTAVKNWIGAVPVYKTDVTNSDNITSVTAVGTGLLGEATLTGSPNYSRCYMSNPANGEFADPAFGLLMTDEGFVDGHEVIDSYNKPVDLGKYLCVGAGLLTFGNKAKNGAYIDSCGIYALGQLAGKPKTEGLSFSKIGSASNTTVTVIVTRALYSDLAASGYIVVTREKGLGWVINNANSVARNNSAYFLISTTRTIKYVIEGKRSILVGFIGKPVSRLLYEAARTSLAESFTKDVSQGFLATNPVWDLEIVQSAQAIGKFNLTCKLNPALELTQVDIDAVIERTTI